MEQPPTITAQSERSVVAFAFDANFTLTCEATGNPKPAWVRLVVWSLICAVSNSKYDMGLHWKRLILTYIVLPYYYKVKKYYILNIYVHTIYTNEIFVLNRFYWTKNGLDYNPHNDVRLKTFENSGSFVIPYNKYLVEYQGTYRCYASNKLGVSMSEEIHFIVPCKLFFFFQMLLFKCYFLVTRLDQK